MGKAGNAITHIGDYEKAARRIGPKSCKERGIWCELFKALERFELLETFERLELSLPKSFLHGARSISIVGANDAADKPTEMFAVEPAYVETAGAICIEIRNRLAAPKIDSPLIIGGDVGAGSAAPVKKGDFVICAGSSRANEE